MIKKPTVAIVDDDPLILSRLASIVNNSKNLSLLFTAQNIQSTIKLMQSELPNVLLLDLGLPDGSGIDVIRWIQKEKLSIGIIVITVFGDEKHMIEAISAGAMGYLLKDDEHQEIETSITQMLNGGSPISPSIARHLLKNFRLQNIKDDKQVMGNMELSLTKRENEILQKISKGFTCKEISAMENLSYHTITTHVRNIYKKLSVSNRAEALHEAYNMGLL